MLYLTNKENIIDIFLLIFKTRQINYFTNKFSIMSEINYFVIVFIKNSSVYLLYNICLDLKHTLVLG